MKAVVVYNPRSGSSLPRGELKKLFEDARVTIEAFIDITDNFAASIKPYRNQKKIIVIGYGGDGTLNGIASELVGTTTIFAPLPGGTLNHFTKDLGIPQDIQEAIMALQNSKPRCVDTASVNTRLFLNNSALGFYPQAVRFRDEINQRAITKWTAMILGSFKAFVRYRSYKVEIAGNSFTTPFVFVGNNDYELEQNIIGERNKLDERILSVYVLTSSRRIHILQLFIAAIFGKLSESPDMKILKVDKITVKSRHKHIRVSRDGEHTTLQPPLSYTINPKSLTILGITKR